MLAFPPEIVSSIASHLHQSEKLTLAFTCRRFYHILLPTLYETIILDSSKRDLSLDSSPIENSSATVVRSAFALRRLLGILAQNPDCCCHVKAFFANYPLPDVPTLQISQQLSAILPFLVNLSVLEIDLRILDLSFKFVHLPASIQRLRGSFLHCTTGNEITHLDIANDAATLGHTSLGDYPKLRYLRVSPSSRLHLARPGDLTKLFKDQPKLSLHSLTIEGMTLDHVDGKILAEHVDFSETHTFALVDCTERFFTDSPVFNRSTAPSNTFLSPLCGKFRTLRNLTLQLQPEIYSDCNTAGFICSLPGLTKLSLRTNVSGGELATLTDAIACHSTTVRKLTLSLPSCLRPLTELDFADFAKPKSEKVN